MRKFAEQFLTYEILCQLISVDEDSGIATWKLAPKCAFDSELKWKRHNNEKAGSIIDPSANSKGYQFVWLFGASHRLHRIIYCIYNVIDLVDCPNIVDHANGNTLDNSKNNLRKATPQQNARNSKLNKNNKSGHSGVYWCNNDNLWKATVRVDGKVKYLGGFKDKNLAISARVAGEVKYFGEFSRNYGS